MIIRFCMFFLFSCPLFLSAQLTDKTTLFNESPNLLMGIDSLDEEYKPRPQVNYEVGTSAFTNFDGFYGFNMYVAPKLVYQPTNNWIVDGGVVLGRTQMYNTPIGMANGGPQQMDQTLITIGAYARGTYLINDKLYMGGTGFMSYNHLESTVPNANRNAYNNVSGETFVGYKFSDSFKVEVGFGVGRYAPQNSFNYVPF